MPPSLVHAALKTIDLVEGMGEARAKLKANTARMRSGSLQPAIAGPISRPC